MNLEVLTPADLLSRAEKPALREVRSLILDGNDTLILCAGFEDRALGALNLTTDSAPSFTVMAIEYRPHVSANRMAQVQNHCTKFNLGFERLVYDRLQPAGFGQYICNRLRRSEGRIIVDVSGMSRLLIVQLITALSQTPTMFDRCSILYTEATHYPPSEERARELLLQQEADPSFAILFLSSGVYEVTILPELSSVAPAGSQTRLVAFPSLDAHHITGVRVELQPSRFTFIEGMPPDPLNQWRKDVIAQINHLDDYVGADRRTVSTMDYREALKCLVDVYDHSLRDRLLVCPTGSKMQSVAVGIFRSFVEDVQIVYPTPHGFCSPECYTEGVGPTHRLDLSTFNRDRMELG